MVSTAEKTTGTGLAANVSVRTGADAVGDVIFLPTDRAGIPGDLNSTVLEQLGLGTSLIPTGGELADGYAMVATPRKQLICFVVTVAGRSRTANLLKTNLTAALRDDRLSGANELWIPLMGTGAGRLSHTQSYDIITTALEATGWLRRNASITISYPPGSLVPTARASAGDAEEQAQSFIEREETSQLPLSAAVSGALRFAAALRSGRSGPGGPISTTLLFFALTESQAEPAPRELAQDRTAAIFSGAVHFLAGEQHFRAAWDHYFVPGYRLPAALPDPRAFKMTPNVAAALQEAALLAKNSASIEIDHLIRSLLKYSRGRHRQSVEAMGISMDDLLAQYDDALNGLIGKQLLNDTAAETDRLGYKIYAEAIKNFLADPNTPPPLSISIQAPWGAGKSSLMQQIRNQLDPQKDRDRNKPNADKAPAGGNRLKLKGVLEFLDRLRSSETPEIAVEGRLWTVWFNAWKYDTSEQLWAGLVDAIVSQISNRLEPVDRELFLLRLQLSRIDDGIVRRKIYDRVITIWWEKIRTWLLWGAAAVASSWGIHQAVPDLAIWTSLLAWTAFLPVVSPVILAVFLAATYSYSRAKTHGEPASFSLAEYLTVPNYHQALGTIHHIHQDLLRVLALTPLRKRTKEETSASPIVVFIDDLDRCSPSKIASVVEGVSMFLASEDYRCMFVIGMDPQMVAAALEEAHAKVRDQLPSYERTVPLGWRFMDKFIQLPFTIPPSNKKDLDSYIGWLSEAPATLPVEDSSPVIAPNPVPDSDLGTRQLESGAEEIAPPVAAPPSSKAAATADNKPVGTDAAVREFKESREVGIMIRSAANTTSGNPREIKRLANLARLYLGLRNAKRVSDPSWRSPSLDQYSRWIIVALRWPDMMRWLLWGADEAIWPAEQASNGLPERRIRFLQDQAHLADDAEAWVAALKKFLKVPVEDGSDWARDHKLFEFFRAEAELASHECLSNAVSRGFW